MLWLFCELFLLKEERLSFSLVSVMHRCWMLMSNMVKVSNIRLEFIQITYMNQKLRLQVVFSYPWLWMMSVRSTATTETNCTLSTLFLLCTESSTRHFVFITADSFCMQNLHKTISPSFHMSFPSQT